MEQLYKYDDFYVIKLPEYQASFSLYDCWKADIFIGLYLSRINKELDLKVVLTSGKRSVEWNRKVGGVENSDHLWQGSSAAIDFQLIGRKSGLIPVKFLVVDMVKLFQSYQYKQLIFYLDKNFIHLSLPEEGRCGERLYCRTIDGKKRYFKSFSEADAALGGGGSSG